MSGLIAGLKSAEVVEYLEKRRSVMARNMIEPGPSQGEIEQMLAIAARVPDHGKLSPFYFKIFQGEDRAKAGAWLRQAYLKDEDPNASEAKLQLESERFMRAPTVIVAVSAPKLGKIPEWEQVLCVGAACQNLVIAANALGYCIQWLTEWYSFSPDFASSLGLMGDNEKIAGVFYIGTPAEPPQERARPDINDLIK